jgi:leader peptidase (prepilin peptidase)/N-methyltransferase
MNDPGSMLIAALLGAMIGSFLNVCVYRLPLGRSVVRPGSACGSCGHQLAWFENIPLASYVVLRGSCRVCRAPISIRYPLIETLTAAMFVAAWSYYGPGVLLVSRLVLGCALIALFAIDLEHQLLPNAITIPGIFIGFAFSLITEPGWLDSLLGIAIGGGALWAIAEGYYRLRHEEGLGMGDVKMLAMIGAFVGWRLTILTLMVASFAGSLVGLFLVLSRRGSMKYALPFGTFLALGAALSATVGPDMLDWYLGFYH